MVTIAIASAADGRHHFVSLDGVGFRQVDYLPPSLGEAESLAATTAGGTLTHSQLVAIYGAERIAPAWRQATTGGRLSAEGRETILNGVVVARCYGEEVSIRGEGGKTVTCRVSPTLFAELDLGQPASVELGSDGKARAVRPGSAGGARRAPADVGAGGPG